MGRGGPGGSRSDDSLRRRMRWLSWRGAFLFMRMGGPWDFLLISFRYCDRRNIEPKFGLSELPSSDIASVRLGSAGLVVEYVTRIMAVIGHCLRLDGSPALGLDSVRLQLHSITFSATFVARHSTTRPPQRIVSNFNTPASQASRLTSVTVLFEFNTDSLSLQAQPPVSEASRCRRPRVRPAQDLARSQ